MKRGEKPVVVTSLTGFTREESRQISDAMLRFAHSAQCSGPMGAALAEIFGDLSTLDEDRRIAAESEPCQSVFHTWFMFDRPIAKDGHSLVDVFLNDEPIKLTRGQRRYLERMQASYLRPYEVREVHFDSGLVLRDLWSDAVVPIRERVATYYAKPGTALFARIIEGPDGEPEMHGLLTFPRADMNELLWHLRSLHRLIGRREPELSDRDFFKDKTSWILPAWLETFRTPPRNRRPLPGQNEKHESKTRVLQLRIELEGVRPQVWRRVLVPERITLPTLSKVVERVMGWESYHLHGFEIDGIPYGVPDPEYPSDRRNERGRRLSDFDLKKSSAFKYQYDFGDNWQHRIFVEAILEAEAGAKYPVCVTGARACPPEDVGGVGGYAEFRRVLRNPRHAEYEHYRQWSRRSRREFDPNLFDLAAANRGLTARVLLE